MISHIANSKKLYFNFFYAASLDIVDTKIQDNIIPLNAFNDFKKFLQPFLFGALWKFAALNLNFLSQIANNVGRNHKKVLVSLVVGGIFKRFRRIVSDDFHVNKFRTIIKRNHKFVPNGFSYVKSNISGRSKDALVFLSWRIVLKKFYWIAFNYFRNNKVCKILWDLVRLTLKSFIFNFFSQHFRTM